MIVHFQSLTGPRWGVLTSPPPTGPADEIEIMPIQGDATTTGELIALLDANRGVLDHEGRERISAATLLSPVTDNASLVCQGLNYRDHAAEAGHHDRKANLLFAKASSSISGPYDDIVRPDDVELLDYEIEVGIVLRRKLAAGDRVDETNLGSFVAGVVLCNDVSARDTMFGASFMQWYQGKSYRTFCPTGPVLYLLDPEEVAATIGNLEIALTYNGEVRQAANTAQLIHKPAETLTQLAAIIDLKAGDMILTGTPGGVIAQGTPELMAALKTHLLDDVPRREKMRSEMKRLGNFLQPGETLALTLHDATNGRSLGGQYCRIA